MFKTILSNFHLEKIWWIFKKKLIYMIMAAIILGSIGAEYAMNFSSTIYRAQISFYVYTNPEYATDSGVNLNSSEITSASKLLSSYMQILRSNTFLQDVLDETGLEAYGYSVKRLRESISSAAVSGTAVFNVYVYDESAMVAMLVANTIGKLAPNKIISIVKSGGIEVLDEAELPTQPYAQTSVLKYAFVAAVAGFVLAFLFVMLKGLLNTTIRRKYEIEDRFTIPIIGTVPEVTSTRRSKIGKLLSDDSPFIIKEAYNDIRTNLSFVANGEKCPVYAITSADGSEGKSLNSINVAAAFGILEKKVLLIDADMRRSEMAETLGINIGDGDSDKYGLSDYLAGITEKMNIRKTENGFDVFLAGRIPPNPSVLLQSSRFKNMLNKLKEEYDIILIDLPPVGIVSDALIVTEDATAYILIVREGVTKFDREEMIVSKLENVNAEICGFIYNGIAIDSNDYNYKHYGYESGYEKKSEGKKTSKKKGSRK